MASTIAAAYCSGYLGPGNIQKYISNIQQSRLTTAILWALHIGRPSIPGQHYGDLIFNDSPNLFVSQGKFNPNNNSNIAAWPGQIAQLKQGGSAVSKIFFSIGGANPPVYDFTSIQYMLKNGLTGALVQNFTALRKAFTVNGTCVIDGFDLDCEEFVDQSTIVQFSQILFKLGFQVTFCPFDNQSFWQGAMQTLWNQGMKVSWWNLQCYAGGYGNRSDLSPWIQSLAAVVGKQAAPSFLVPGLAVQGSEGDGQCPTGNGGICPTFAGWSKLGLGGGFLWLYDAIIQNSSPCPGPADLAAYVAAINNGLKNNCG
jgi:hypothetical protein